MDMLLDSKAHSYKRRHMELSNLLDNILLSLPTKQVHVCPPVAAKKTQLGPGRLLQPNHGLPRFPPLLPPPSLSSEGTARRSLASDTGGEALSSSRVGRPARAGVFG